MKPKQKATILSLEKRINDLEATVYSLLISAKNMDIVLSNVVTRHNWQDDMNQIVKEYYLKKATGANTIQERKQ